MNGFQILFFIIWFVVGLGVALEEEHWRYLFFWPFYAIRHMGTSFWCDVKDMEW